MVVSVVSVSVIVTVFGTINLVSLVITTETTEGAHGVGRVSVESVVSIVIASLKLTEVSVVLSFSLRFSLSLGFSLRVSLSLSLENSVVLAPVLVVSKVRSVVGRHVALGEDGVVVVGLVGTIVGSIVGAMAVESWAAIITLSSTGPSSKIARISLGLGLRLGQSRNNEKTSKYL